MKTIKSLSIIFISIFAICFFSCIDDDDDDIVPVYDEMNGPMPIYLKKMTTELIFNFYDSYKVPVNSDYRLTVGVENIPSAFFIATGRTLSTEEVEDMGLNRYTGERNVPVPADDDKNAVVTIFHTLSNDNIPESDRGRYWFGFKENLKEGEQIKAASEELDKFSPEHPFSLYIYGLYDKEHVLVKSMQKTE